MFHVKQTKMKSPLRINVIKLSGEIFIFPLAYQTSTSLR